MLWVLVLAALVAVSVHGAHRLLEGVDAFRSSGRVPPLSRALVYAAAVVVGSQATDAALSIDRTLDRQLGLPSGDKAEVIVQVLSSNATSIAWQAGLLLAAAALLASARDGETRRVP